MFTRTFFVCRGAAAAFCATLLCIMGVMLFVDDAHAGTNQDARSSQESRTRLDARTRSSATRRNTFSHFCSLPGNRTSFNCRQRADTDDDTDSELVHTMEGDTTNDHFTDQDDQTDGSTGTNQSAVSRQTGVTNLSSDTSSSASTTNDVSMECDGDGNDSSGNCTQTSTINGTTTSSNRTTVRGSTTNLSTIRQRKRP